MHIPQLKVVSFIIVLGQAQVVALLKPSLEALRTVTAGEEEADNYMLDTLISATANSYHLEG